MKSPLKDLQPSLLMLLCRLQRSKSQSQGMVLVVVVVGMLVTVPALLTTFALLNKVDTTTSSASARSNTGFYAAEAGLNLRAKEIRDEFEGFNRPQGTSPTSWENCTDTNASNNGSSDFVCRNQTFQGHSTSTYVRDLQAGGLPAFITIPPGEPFAGLSAQEYRYEVVSVARDPGSDSPNAILTMRFKSRLVPLFQFVVFYGNDSEFTIPPNMTLNGPVHGNGDLYLNAGSGYTLTINGQVSTAGRLYRGEKADDSCSGTVKIYDTSSTARNLNCNSSGSRTTYNQTTTSPSSISSWGNLMRIGMDPLTVPQPDDLNPEENYWDRSDLRVVLKLDNNGHPSGIEVRNLNNSVNNTATNNLQNSCASASTTLQNEPDGSQNYENDSTVLKVNSVAGFAVGDAVTIDPSTDSNTSTTRFDLDSNVISAIDTPNKTMTLKRQIGHDYQTSPVVGVGGTVRKAIVSTSNTFYNYREKQGGSGGGAGNYIRMLNVDAQGLLRCANSQNLMGGKALNDDTEGGLVWYLTVDGPGSLTNVTNGGSPNKYGVRVYNGSELTGGAPAIQGLTIVSDQAAYIQGNYNSTNKKPAAFLADTINVLSNAWKLDDSNGTVYSAANLPANTTSVRQKLCNSSTSNTNSCSSDTSSLTRIPTATTVNAAFLSGTEITGGSNGTAGQGGANSGGVNNYPRFHEHWNANVAFNYRGSFVSLSRPRRVNSSFCASYQPAVCNIYSPPIRNWDFDVNFNDANSLPPLTPRAVYLRQEFFSRNFERASINLWPIPVSLLPLGLFGLLYSSLRKR